MKHKNNSISSGILFKSALVALLLGISLTSWSQIITTFAGNGKPGYQGDGGQATAAELKGAWSIVLDASGNIYISDYSNNLIRKVNTSGVISTFAGIASGAISGDNEGYSGDGGPATAAELFFPRGMAIDASGNVYIADYRNSLIRIVNTSGIINTFAGIASGAIDGSNEGYSGDGGPATAAEFYFPSGVAVDPSGNVYIADEFNNLIREVNTSGIISTFAGIASGAIDGSNYGYSGDGDAATDAEIAAPVGIAVGISGDVYIADGDNYLVRKVNTSGIISTFAGIASGAIDGSNEGYSGDGGPATAAEVSPYAMTMDASGNVYIADGVNSLVRIVNTSGIINTFAGIASGAEAETNEGYSGDGGPATAADLNGPSGIAVDASGNVYIADHDNNVVRKVSFIFYVLGNVTANISCNGESNGSASVSSSYGTSPYTYSWSPSGGTNSTTTGLSAGTYTITVIDGGDSTASAIVIITQPNALSISTPITANVSCNGGNNGNASVTPLGGTSPYTYSWSGGGGTNSTAGGLSAGIYTLTVQDNCGESATASVTITQHNALSTTASATANVSCNGGNNGSASATLSGGTSPYTYSWSGGGGNNATTSGLSAGTYTVTVSDSCSSSATASVTITQPLVMTILHDSVAATVGCNGIAAVTPSGGTSSYTYSWTFGQTTDTIKGLCANNYCCTITDNNGCSQTTCITVKSATGIDNISNSSTITIYPNPNTGQFTLSGLQKGMILEMYDYTGKKISTSSITNQTMQLNVSQADGVYLIRILDKDGNLVTEKKVVKMQ